MPFNIYLANLTGGNDDLIIATQGILQNYFTQCANATHTLGGVRVITGNSVTFTRKDLLCYIVNSFSNSVVNRWASGIQPSSGNTACDAASKTSATEVYIDRTVGDAERARLLANLIFHEFMHNKQCADNDTVHDNGGLGTTPVNASTPLTAANITFMRSYLGSNVTQWEGGF